MICIYGLDEHLSFEELGAVEILQSLGAQVYTVLPPGEAVSKESHRFTSKARIRIVPFDEPTISSISVLVNFGKKQCFDLMRGHGVRPEHIVYSSDNITPENFEISALQEGLIDEVFCKNPRYAAEYIRKLVMGAGRGVEHRAGYAPFCNPLSPNSGLVYAGRPVNPEFDVLQVFRPGCSKFCFPGHWKMLCGVTAPWHRKVQFSLLGFDENTKKIVGEPFQGLNFRLSEGLPKSYEEQKVYGGAHVLLQHHPVEETFAFDAAKAMLTGGVVVGPPTGAYIDIITHGETGFLASTPDEAAYLTSKLAWEPSLRAKISSNAYSWFVSEGPGNADLCSKWWKDFV
jgi:glycosyltransferase involved in cell wall biosynthesis